MPVLETLGGALFGAVLQMLFDKLDSHQVLGFFRGRNLDEKLLKKLKRKLMDINAVIDDAEQKQFTNSLVKEWLDEVRDVLYDAEDLLEQIDYEFSKTKLEAEFQTSSSKVYSFESKIIALLDDLESLLNQKIVKDFKIYSGVRSELGNKVSDKKVESTSLVAEEWCLRTSMDSSHIVEVNGLLRKPHVSRISQTPFKWCLEIATLLEVNLKLLKEMVVRWDGHHESFRVSQQLVPLKVLDVFMSLGLQIGGLDVPTDELVVGIVGQMFNTKATTLKDLMNMFHTIVNNDEIEVDVLWAFERLSLHDHSSQRRFPHIWIWCPFKSRTKKISVLFQAGEVNLNWYVHKLDRGVEAIRAAFHLDREVKAEGSRLEGCNVEEEENENSDDDIREVTVEERMRTNNIRIRNVNAKIAALTQEIYDIRQNANVRDDRHEETTGACDEEGCSGADEEVVVACDEEVVVGVDEEPAGTYNKEPAGAYHEEAAVEGAGGSGIERVVIEIADDEGDDYDIPLAIPLCAIMLVIQPVLWMLRSCTT
ncbi:putative disease resistance RPP13-like protein [Vigna angularis]|nr:putative disease resistance RPP13-like protein [Vigna angularis]